MVGHTQKLRSWLDQNGGLAVHLRPGPSSVDRDTHQLVNALLDIPKVATLLSYLDGFSTPERDKKSLEHLIHYYKNSCIENFFPQLVNLGFRTGISQVDNGMHFVREIYQHLQRVDDEYGLYYRLMLHPHFFKAGYTYPEVVDAMLQRLDRLTVAAQDGIFDVYQDKSKLPKVPERWADRGVLKDRHNPFSRSAQAPLPTIYDLRAMAYLPVSCRDADTDSKINDVVAYILEPRFQQLPEGYGLLRVKGKRTYHACGWSPTLPNYADFDRPAQLGEHTLLTYAELMSHFRVAQQSSWFVDALAHLAAFETAAGTYLFPKEYFQHKPIEAAFLSETNLILKRNARRQKYHEVVSTLSMVEILDRCQS